MRALTPFRRPQVQQISNAKRYEDPNNRTLTAAGKAKWHRDSGGEEGSAHSQNQTDLTT